MTRCHSNMSPWRNRLARSAVNRKAGGSSPPGDVFCVQQYECKTCMKYFSSGQVCFCTVTVIFVILTVLIAFDRRCLLVIDFFKLSGS